MRRFFLLSGILLLFFARFAVGANQLTSHPSPYLALHGNDPVQWQDWSAEVVETAKRENKLIFISSGYFSCHWCHVMQRESYQNARIAELLNTYFIPVKIDRELQPALDAHLIDFVEKTRGTAGWPLNVFLTPEGYPLVGLTYSPSQPFEGLLRRLIATWVEKESELRSIARTALEAMRNEASVVGNPLPVDKEVLHVGLVTMALALGDEMEGGFGRQSRFPMSPQWSVLIERMRVRPDQKLTELIELSLDQMSTQGLRDHIGGGFYRYTVDPSWQVPHYEKMLYTQALLTRLFLQGAELLGRTDYLEVARETLDFSLRELSTEEGGFIASLSAVDALDREGAAYLWDEDQLAESLQEDELTFAVERWRLHGVPATEGGWLPVQSAGLEQLASRFGLTLVEAVVMEKRIREKLLQARQLRNHPRDDKLLAAWNGLMLSALVDGARVLGDERYRQAARQLRDFLVSRLWDGRQLFRSYHESGPLGEASIEDYAYVSAGLLDWSALTGSAEDRKLALRLVETAWSLFYDQAGWRMSDRLQIPGITSQVALTDGPLPSPAAILIDLALRLGDEALRDTARLSLRLSVARVQEQPIWHATHAAQLLNHSLD